MTAWIVIILATVVLLVVDLALVRGRGGVMNSREAAVASVAWVAAAALCAVGFALFGQQGQASAFVAGYLVEKSLSLDNVFVFLIVFSAFGVATAARHRLLTYGIVGALVLRAVFIVAGAAALSRFGWVAWLFAALLIWTGWRLWTHRHDHDGERALVERIRGRLPIADADPDDRRFLVRRDGRLALTVGGAALLAIAVVDIIFAVDSVPAILAITDDAVVVFAANAFALLGLRPLFFLVASLVDRLYYLKAALAALLVFIGLKLVLAEFVGKIGPEYSLSAVVVILGTGVVASLVRERRLARRLARAH